MTNNDILRRVRYIFDFKDSNIVALFALADHEVSPQQVKSWLLKDEDPDLNKLSDLQLATFLNGLINDRRGKREGTQPEPESQLSNNMILRKLRIALDYKDNDMLETLKLSDVHISKHELSAFFRKVGHKHYRECKDQVLRNFLKGLQMKLRPEVQSTKSSVWKK
ncbi:MAG: DUF1456 family protein [Gammaproteobacteria bacterium]|nr:DUF1456 family protein [Gammaproteobacteria bacterium]NNJ90736.1 DUF1456 family protein [Gammaproteobacteria bacterium]